MRKIQFALLLVVLLLTMLPANSFALSPEKLPVKMASKHWSLLVGKADHPDSELNRSKKPALYHFYSMDIKNNSEDKINCVRIEAYRDDPKIDSDVELFTINCTESSASSFHHQNFPLMNGSKLKVVVTYTMEKNTKTGRKYQDHFMIEN